MQRQDYLSFAAYLIMNSIYSNFLANCGRLKLELLKSKLKSCIELHKILLTAYAPR